MKPETCSDDRQLSIGEVNVVQLQEDSNNQD